MGPLHSTIIKLSKFGTHNLLRSLVLMRFSLLLVHLRVGNQFRFLPRVHLGAALCNVLQHVLMLQVNSSRRSNCHCPCKTLVECIEMRRTP